MKHILKSSLVTIAVAATLSASSQPGGGSTTICYDACTTESPCATGNARERGRIYCKSLDVVTHCIEYEMVTYNCKRGGPGDGTIGRQLEEDVRPADSCDGSNYRCH
jgi:hypothetical protein